jgi:proteic killer suppression protein
LELVLIYEVALSKNAKKDLLKIPTNIVRRLMVWVESVKHDGLENVRKLKGYHDEPLSGKRFGQRSIRLSRSYRAIYSLEDKEVTIAVVQEVNKHDY